MNDEYLTPSEVARLLKVSSRTVINMIHSQKLKALEVAGKKRMSYRILLSELDRFIAKEYEKYED